MGWFRIDNRLVHGQVVEGWIPHLDAGHLIVINDALAHDELQQKIMQIAIPARIQTLFLPLSQAKQLHEIFESEGKSVLYLFSNCQDARRLAEQGVHMPVLNIGNLHYSRGKRQLCAHVAISDDDAACMHYFRCSGTTFDFRCIPTDVPVVGEW